ncbi:MAG: hypothetical protein KDD02_08215 [Phaeodactylibacter sp.]|nr:hypothetical protein [Phaeodactylibacter sp.]
MNIARVKQKLNIEDDLGEGCPASSISLVSSISSPHFGVGQKPNHSDLSSQPAPGTTSAESKQEKKVKEEVSGHEAVRRQMRKVTEEVRHEYHFFRSLACKMDVQEGVLELLEKKLFESTPARPFFVRSLYQYIREEKGIDNRLDIHFRARLPLVFEIVICVQYYDNQILDGKAAVKSKQQINRNKRKAYRLKQLLYEYIICRFPSAISKEIKNSLDRVFLFVDLGQKMELDFNHAHFLLNPEIKNVHLKDFVIDYLSKIDSNNLKNLDEKELLIRDNLKNAFSEFNNRETFFDNFQIANEISRYTASIAELPEVKAYKEIFPEDYWFLKLYFQRISLTSGALYYFATQLTLDLLGISGETRSTVLLFARYFGLARQIVNDNKDNVPSYFNETTNAKVCKDAFSDLRNGNITLPVYLLWVFREKNGFLSFLFKHSKTIFKKGFPKIVEKTLFQAFTQSFSIYISLSISKDFAAYASLQLNSENPYFKNLDYMSRGLAGYNKYYRHFYKEKTYATYKKVKYQIGVNGTLNHQRKFRLGIEQQIHYVKENNNVSWFLEKSTINDCSSSVLKKSWFYPFSKVQPSRLKITEFLLCQCYRVLIQWKNLRLIP